MLQDTPVPFGATRASYRADDKPYVHQAYPTTRFHPDGSEVTVQNAEAAAILGPPWRDKPYPPPPVVVPEPQPTVPELQARIAALTADKDALTKKVADLEAVCMERAAEIEGLKAAKKAKPAANAKPAVPAQD